jgi:signal peptidase I
MTDQEAKASQRAPATSAAGLKETVESILIALILAFIFRAFVVEAFVIPTGSMATSLLGAHVRFTCDDCGHRFNHNFPAGETMRVDRVATHRQIAAFCPNCQYQNEISSPAVYYGDRILVLKYLYLLQEPQRWDVVVFKSPHDPTYEQNYIKRLVGKPGEQVMILDGDIYVRRHEHEHWQVQSKPRVVQEALWRVIHDHDHQPRGLARPERWQRPWQFEPDSGWRFDQQNPRVLHFNSFEEAAPLRYVPQPLPTPRTIPSGGDFTDWLAYNVTPRFDAREYSATPVSDLKLRLYYQRHEGTGPLHLRLTKREHTFIAEITPDRARILLQVDGGEPQPWQEPVSLPDNGPLLIEFSNVDYHVTLRVNDSDLISGAYQPDVERLLVEYERGAAPPIPRVEIAAEQQRSSISHLSLWRDIYYLNHPVIARWGRPDHVITLDEGEYFVLGDNSINSLDSRGWHAPVELPHEDLRVEAGRVPERFMLGKAFFVYWPAGYRPLAPWMPGLVPNFAEMRFIH